MKRNHGSMVVYDPRPHCYHKGSPASVENLHCDLLNTGEGSYKTRNGTERNGTGSNWWTIRAWTPDTPCVNMSAHQGTESSSHVLYQPRRRDKHPADSIESHQSY